MLGFVLSIFEHIDILGDALCGCILCQHLGWEVDLVNCMEATAALIKVVNKVGGGNGIVE
jgi:hypothetical protein